MTRQVSAPLPGPGKLIVSWRKHDYVFERQETWPKKKNNDVNQNSAGTTQMLGPHPHLCFMPTALSALEVPF